MSNRNLLALRRSDTVVQVFESGSFISDRIGTGTRRCAARPDSRNIDTLS